MSDCDHKKVVFVVDTDGADTIEVCPICDNVEIYYHQNNSKINE